MSTFADTGIDYATPLTINSRERVIRSETLNLKTQTNSNDSQRWDLVITLAPVADRDSTDASKIAIHRNLNGLSKSFTTAMPQYPGIAASSTATVSINGTKSAYSATGTYTEGDVVTFNSKEFRANKTIAANEGDPENNTADWDEISTDMSGDVYLFVTSTSAVTLPAGLFIKTAGQSKIYMVEEELTTNSHGKALKVFPPLTANVLAGDTQIDTSPDILCYYAPDGVEGITVTEGIVTRATVQLVEALA